MPTYPHIESYYKELEDIIQFGGSDNELSIRQAFQDCLSEYCSIHRENLKLIPELAAAGGIPNGTVKDSLRMARGYWEAKDTHDDLDTENSFENPSHSIDVINISPVTHKMDD